MRFIGFVLCLALVASLAGAQIYQDSFSSTSLLGWTQVSGVWTASNGRLNSQQVASYQYLTLDSSKTQNGMVEIKVFYDPASPNKLQFGGGTFRFVSTSTCVMNKTQDNNSSGDFDRFFLYDYPGGSSYVDPTPHKSAIVRLGAIGSDLIGKIDIDMDGKWDNVILKTPSNTPTAAKVGIAGYGGAQFDDFKYFDAIVRLSPTSNPPKPANLVTLDLAGDPGLSYQCACSFGSNIGVPMRDGRRIPLNLDPLLDMSLQVPSMFQNFTGTLSKSGTGVAGVQIPRTPAMTGVTFYFGMITLDQTKPFGIGNISNDLRIDIQ